MRRLAISALFVLGSVGAASAQALAGGAIELDCRPIATTDTEKGVSVTRAFRAQDKVAIGTVAGHRCYAPAAPTQGPATAPTQTIVLIRNNTFGRGNGFLTGFNVGTSPNVLGAPQPARF